MCDCGAEMTRGMENTKHPRFFRSDRGRLGGCVILDVSPSLRVLCVAAIVNDDKAFAFDDYFGDDSMPANGQSSIPRPSGVRHHTIYLQRWQRLRRSCIPDDQCTAVSSGGCDAEQVRSGLAPSKDQYHVLCGGQLINGFTAFRPQGHDSRPVGNGVACRDGQNISIRPPGHGGHQRRFIGRIEDVDVREIFRAVGGMKSVVVRVGVDEMIRVVRMVGEVGLVELV